MRWLALALAAFGMIAREVCSVLGCSAGQRCKETVMGLIIVRHKVKDFAAWKPAFESHTPAQTAAGLSNPRVFRSADDPSEVVILFDAQDIGKAKQFVGSPDLRSAMATAGVTDKPDIYFLNAAN
jgi:hypothetical protein